jgi:hypothetical protein
LSATPLSRLGVTLFVRRKSGVDAFGRLDFGVARRGAAGSAA